MAFFKFARLPAAGKKIPIYNHGKLRRDFTYIDDARAAVVKIIDAPPTGPNIYNIGNGKTVQLMDSVRLLEKALGCRADYEMTDMQPGDAPATYADMTKLTEDYGYVAKTDIATGLDKFATWYKKHYAKEVK